MPAPVLFLITELRMMSFPPAVVLASEMPCSEKSEITVSSTITVTAWVMLMPRRRTVRNGSLALTGMLMLKPLVPLASTDPIVPVQSIVMDLVMVKVPKPPGSRQSISPLINVFEIAPAKVLHGAVRLHGSASLPTPETKVRVAWACAGADNAKAASVVPTTANNFDLLCIFNLRLGLGFACVR